MTIAVTDILLRAGDLLQDAQHVRWTPSALVRWMNDCMADISSRYQNATSAVETLSLVRGPVQSLPDTMVNLLAVYGNISSSGATFGPSITPIDRTTLDQLVPGWQDNAVIAYTDHVENVIDNPASPRNFLVFPGNTGSGSIQVLAARNLPRIENVSNPDDVASYNDSELDLDVRYIGPVVDYVVSRAWGSDVDVPNALNRSRLSMQSYNTGMVAAETIDTLRTTAEAETIALSPEASS